MKTEKVKGIVEKKLSKYASDLEYDKYAERNYC